MKCVCLLGSAFFCSLRLCRFVFALADLIRPDLAGCDIKSRRSFVVVLLMLVLYLLILCR